MLIDTHLHLVDRNRLTYPWLADAPALNQDWTYENYEVVARRLGIGKTLHMEVDVIPADIGNESRMVTDLMQRENSLIAGAISSARPEDAGFEAFLDGLDPNTVKGLRRVLHVVPDDVSRSEVFRSNTRLMGTAGLPFDICMLARQLPLACELVDSAENTTFVLDHCGVPDISGDGFASWSAQIIELAKRPHVNAKISGITAYAKQDWSLQTLRPYVEHIIDAFGWDRVVWGSDSPVCTLNATLAQWVAVTHALTSGASATDLAQFHNQNATRIWAL